ncbi:MAG: hypothetical protein J6Q41_03510 [Firmicutes bacterium]|nr:hypothetical protein [Bacillota bacterium]
MNIGVKFCGGCNPKYDRGKLYQKIPGAYPDHSFELADENKKYDLLLVICGCERVCADVSRYKAERILRISEDQIPEL